MIFEDTIYGRLLLFLISFLITWGVGLFPPLLIRFVIVKKPLSKGIAIALATLFFFFNIVFFTLIGSESRTHGVLVLIGIVSYHILRSGDRKNASDESKTELNNMKSNTKL